MRPPGSVAGASNHWAKAITKNVQGGVSALLLEK
jgi:hypothetical protein